MASEEDAAGGAGALVKALPAEQMKRLEALQQLQKDHLATHLEFVAERKALETKYAALYGALYAKRADIVTGAVDPAAAAEGDKGLPGFWLQCLNNCPRIARYIEEWDEAPLKALTDITLETLEDYQGFRLRFKFAPNEWFDDAELTKTFHIPDMLGGAKTTSEPTVEKVEGCDIHWKPSKNLTVKEVKKVTKKKGKKVTSIKAEPQPSFFTFFDTVDLSEEPDNMEEALEMQEQVQGDMTIGFAIRSKIIPRAADWFTGEALEDESDDEEDYEGEDDEGDDDDDDEEDDEEDARPARGGKGGKGGKGKARGDDEDEEEEEEEGDRAALADAFKKGVKVSGGKGKGGKDGSSGGGGGGGGGAPASGDKPPECKQQ